jgi:hypothetical protein
MFVENIAKHGKFYGGGSSKEEYEEGGRGGAIYNYGKTIVTSSVFENNTAEGGVTGTEADFEGKGGAIYNEGSLTISSSTFKSNNANGGSNAGASKYNEGGRGGAIYAYERLSATGSTFTANVAHGGDSAEGGAKGGYEGDGGAIYTESEATISASVFTENTAAAGANGSGTNYGSDGEGGAIYNQDGSLVLNSSMVKENLAASAHYGGNGGGIRSYGSLTLNESSVSDNKAPNGYGGGIYNDGGRTNLIQSTVSGNQVPRTIESGRGGGIYNNGTLGVTQSTITNNQAPEGNGGAVYNNGSELELMQSTIGPSNTARNGGGIYNNGPLAATNATIAQNTASEEGGGIYNNESGTLANVTLFGNAAQKASGGGNLYLEAADLKLHDTLIAAGISPTSDGNCAFNGGVIISLGYNAEDANQCKLEGPGDQLNVPLNLAPLGSYGGPTQTVALLPGSAAIDTGDPAGCTGVEGEPLTTDQRGIPRPQHGRCDIGAFEYVFPTPAPVPAPKLSAPRDSALAIGPSSFAPSSSSASIARHHKGKKGPKGATVSYNDSEAATTTFTIVRLQHGYRVKGLCKAASKHGKKPRHGKACTKETLVKGSFVHVDAAGHNHFEFTGHIDGRKLAKGSYVLIAQPKLGTLAGPKISVMFKIS